MRSFHLRSYRSGESNCKIKDKERVGPKGVNIKQRQMGGKFRREAAPGELSSSD